MAKRSNAEKGPRTRALEQACADYFAECDATRERAVLKNGSPFYRQVPYTLSGLAEATGLSREEIRSCASEGRGRARRVLGGALRRIERHLVERVLLGEVQQSVAATLLRELGYGLEPAAPDGKRIVIVMDDQERWGE